MLSSLSGQGLAATSESLGRVSDELARLDAAGLGNAAADYDTVAASLLELAGDGDDARLVQVDMHRAGSGLTLGPDAARQLAKAVDLLHRLSGRRGPGAASFQDGVCGPLRGPRGFPDGGP